MRRELDLNNVNTKRIFWMSLPIFGETLLQLLVGNIDQIMLSQFSQNSVAACGNGNQIMNIAILVLNFAGSGTMVLLTQYIGARDQSRISEVCTVSVTVLSLVGLVASLAATLFSRQIFTAMQVPPEILDEACQYLQIVGSCIFIQGIYLNLAAILRSFSLVKEVLMASIVMNALNVLGNVLLMNGLLGFPRLGLVGVAISTDISKCIGLAILIVLLLRKTNVRIRLSYLRPFPISTLKRLLRVSVPSGAEGLSYQLSQIVILTMINSFGTVAITTKVYTSMIANLTYVYAISFAQASQIAMGYWVGAGDLKKVERNIWRYIGISMAVCMTMNTVFLLFSNQVFGLFTQDPEVLALARKLLIIEYVLEFGRSINVVMVRSLVTTGDIYAPLTAGVISQWLVAAGLGYFFSIVLGWKLPGIWLAMALDEFLRGIVFVIRFKSGAWKKKRLIE